MDIILSSEIQVVNGSTCKDQFQGFGILLVCETRLAYILVLRWCSLASASVYPPLKT